MYHVSFLRHIHFGLKFYTIVHRLLYTELNRGPMKRERGKFYISFLFFSILQTLTSVPGKFRTLLIAVSLEGDGIFRVLRITPFSSPLFIGQAHGPYSFSHARSLV